MRHIFTFTVNLLVLAIFHEGHTQGNQDLAECCKSKTVGDSSYTLLEQEMAPDILGCHSPCVYQRDGEQGSRFCFKRGDLPVTCSSEYIVTNITLLNQAPEVARVNVKSTDGQTFFEQIFPSDSVVVPTEGITVQEVTAAVSKVGDCTPLKNPPAFAKFFHVFIDGKGGCRVDIFITEITFFNHFPYFVSVNVQSAAGETFSGDLSPKNSTRLQTGPITVEEVSASLENIGRCAPLKNPPADSRFFDIFPVEGCQGLFCHEGCQVGFFVTKVTLFNHFPDVAKVNVKTTDSQIFFEQIKPKQSVTVNTGVITVMEVTASVENIGVCKSLKNPPAGERFFHVFTDDKGGCQVEIFIE